MRALPDDPRMNTNADTIQRTVNIKATSRELAKDRAESAFANLGTVVAVEQVLDREYAVTFERPA